MSRFWWKVPLFFGLFSSLCSEEMVIASEAPLSVNEELSRWSVIPYAQVVFILPGAGCSYRYQKWETPYAFQFDVNGALGPGNVWPTSFVWETSVAGIYYPHFSKWNYGGFNLGAGVGVAGTDDDMTFPDLILFAGYQGDRLFCNVDCKFVPNDMPAKNFLVVPAVKLGVCF